MFFRKSEPRGPSACTVLVVGTLVAVGAVTLVTRGRELYENMMCKAKDIASVAKAVSCNCASSADEDE